MRESVCITNCIYDSYFEEVEIKPQDIILSNSAFFNLAQTLRRNSPFSDDNILTAALSDKCLVPFDSFNNNQEQSSNSNSIGIEDLMNSVINSSVHKKSCAISQSIVDTLAKESAVSIFEILKLNKKCKNLYLFLGA